MHEPSAAEAPRHPNFLKRYFITGLLAIIPLWITWVVLAFLFRTLSDIGTPIFRTLANFAGPEYPLVASILESETTLSIVGVILVLAIISQPINMVALGNSWTKLNILFLLFCPGPFPGLQ